MHSNILSSEIGQQNRTEPLHGFLRSQSRISCRRHAKQVAKHKQLLSSLAPVGLVVYNRKNHTQKTIESLKNNTLASETDLYIFSDAANKKEDEKAVNEVREYKR